MSDRKGPINSSQMGLGTVLKQHRVRVPPNQREYSWTEREVTDLLQDLAKAIDDGEAEYFLGTIVAIPQTSEPDLLEVVDGQQRLATTGILLRQIRNYLLGSERVIADSIESEFLSHTDRALREVVPKMQLNVDDNEYFRQLMGTAPTVAPPKAERSSHKLLEDAYLVAGKHVLATVAAHDPKNHGDVLNKWVDFIQHRAQVILLKVSSEANAYKMFETLNDRGLKTSQSDLVKNYLFGQSGGRLPEAQASWTLLRGTLETLDEEDITVTFLSHALIGIRGYLRQPDVYDAVQVQAKGSQASIAFLSQLTSLATTYVAMFNPEDEKWNKYPAEIRRAVKTLNLLNIKPMRPLMLAVAAKFPEKEAAEAFRRFISWQVRLLLAGGIRSGSVGEAFGAAAQKIFAGKIVSAKGLAKELGDVLPNDQQFRQSFEVLTVSKANLARYYLRSLEMTAGSKPEPWFIPNEDAEAVNLEHILPQSKARWEGFDEDTSRANVNRLGNQLLLLAKQNRDVAASDFEAKKVVYGGSPYLLTKQVAAVPAWNPEAIVERQKLMADLALKAWPL